MLESKNKKITMTRGDFGINLPFTISGASIEKEDSIKLTIKEEINGEELITKVYTNIKDNTFDFVLTKEESEKLKSGTYFYSVDWFKNDVFLSNIVEAETFAVRDKV